MCVVSNISDDWTERFPQRFPQVVPSLPLPFPQVFVPQVTREEFEALRKEMEELKKLLVAAKKYDEATGQPDCEKDEKIKLIKAIAKLVGVDLGDVFAPSAAKV